MYRQHWLFILLLFAAGGLIAQHQPRPVFIADSAFIEAGKASLDDRVYYFTEPGKPISIDELLSADSRIKFYPGFNKLPADSLQGNYWITFAVDNSTAAALSLRLHCVSDRFSFYLLNSNGQYKQAQGGFILPYGRWPAMNTVPKTFDPNSYPFTLEPGEVVTVLARSEPMGMSSPEFNGITLYTEKAYLQELGEEFSAISTMQFIFFGMALMMVLFSLSQFVINKDKAYLFYSLYTAGVVYYLMASLGFERLYLFGSNTGFNATGYNLSVYCVSTCYYLFTIYFLHQGGWKPKLKKLMLYYIYFSLACAVISTAYLVTMTEFNRTAMSIMNGVNMPSSVSGILLMLYINIAYLRSKNKTARYFAFAGLTLILGFAAMIFVNLLRVTNVLADTSSSQVNNLVLIFLYEGGFILQILLFALALSYRSRLIEKEKTELEVMDTTKARFFANISHEFKTPLTLILGPTANLLKKTNDDYFRNSLGLIEKNAKRLLGLINEILDLSKLDAGKMELQLQKGDIADFVRKQGLQFSSLAESKNITLDYALSEQSGEIAFDPDKLHKILTNLLSNAFKFTASGGTVSVSTYSVVKGKRQYIGIKIADTGSGIPEKHLQNIFERFYHANQKDYTTDQPGTGIGLALTRELIAMHGGMIEVSSKVNEGSVFTVLLPADLQPAVAAVPVEELIETDETLAPVIRLSKEDQNDYADADADMPQVLLIEDNEELRAYISSCIQTDYLVSEAADGEEGIEKAVKYIPDIIITDVMMPRKDGFEVSRFLKQNEKTNHIPIIILTGKSSQPSRLEGLQTQADVYLAKPFDADELRLQMSNLLKNRERMREHYSKKLFLETTQQEINSIEEEFLQKAIQVVDENLADENFSVEQLSKALFMDRTQLFRKLKALTGDNPSNFIRNLRLKKAKYMLEKAAGTVADIAFAVGFGSTTYFNKCFKELYGESPGKIKA